MYKRQVVSEERNASRPDSVLGLLIHGVQHGLQKVAATARNLFRRIRIGRAAQWDPSARRNFKSRLGPVARLSRSEFDLDNDYLATKAFIQALFAEFLDDYERANGLRAIESIVVTVPDAWVRGDELGGVETLRHAFHDLGLPSPIFLSEPVAAACYFVWLFKEKRTRSFRGHVLVYDHGGSTLDISIVHVDGPIVREVSSYGSGLKGSDEGFGGVYFDQRVLTHIADRTQLPSLRSLANAGSNDPDRLRWLSEFETLKRDQVSTLELADASGTVESLGIISSVEILSSDLTDVFNAEFEEPIRQAILGVIGRAQAAEPFDIRSAESFRVMTVGGFSEFHLIQKLVNTLIASAEVEPDVMQSYLGLNDRWQAVSKGACLVAAEQIEVDYHCPFSFGIIWYKDRIPQDDELLIYGRPHADYRTVCFAGRPSFGLGNERQPLEFYIESSGRRRVLPVHSRLTDILPDYGHQESWRASGVIHEGTVEVVFRNERSGAQKSVRVGRLMIMIDRVGDGQVDR